MHKARSLTARAAATLAALAIAPAVASAAPGTVADDTVGDFSAGTNTGTAVVDPGSVQLVRNGPREEFDGTALPAGFTFVAWDPGPGSFTVDGGTLTVDGGRVHQDPTSADPQVLEFRATFGTADFQNVGFAAGPGTSEDFNAPPWAMFSTGNGTLGPGLYARTAASDANQQDQLIAGIDPTQAHVYRIERTATEVRYFVNGTLVHTATGAFVPATADLRPAASDFTQGGDVVVLDWGQLYTYGTTGTFQSRVLDSGKANTDWTTLTPSASGGVAIETRSGNTATADAGLVASGPPCLATTSPAHRAGTSSTAPR